MAGAVRFSRAAFIHSRLTKTLNRQGKREKLINFKSEWNYVRISKTKAPPPKKKKIPPHLHRPCINLLAKLVSRKWVRIRFFFSSPLNIHKFSLFCAIFQQNKKKIKKCEKSESVFRFKVFLFIKKKWKNRKLLATLVIFFIFLIKMELWKIGR